MRDRDRETERGETGEVGLVAYLLSTPSSTPPAATINRHLFCVHGSAVAAHRRQRLVAHPHTIPLYLSHSTSLPFTLLYTGISFVCTAVLVLPTAGKDSSLILGAVSHLNLKLEKVKVAREEGAEKAKTGVCERMGVGVGVAVGCCVHGGVWLGGREG